VAAESIITTVSSAGARSTTDNNFSSCTDVETMAMRAPQSRRMKAI
jgi:hypothetical protein